MHSRAAAEKEELYRLPNRSNRPLIPFFGFFILDWFVDRWFLIHIEFDQIGHCCVIEPHGFIDRCLSPSIHKQQRKPLTIVSVF